MSSTPFRRHLWTGVFCYPFVGLEAEVLWRHFKFTVDSSGVVVMDLAVNAGHEVFQGIEAMNIFQFLFESSKERFLVAIFPGMGFVTVGRQDLFN